MPRNQVAGDGTVGAISHQYIKKHPTNQKNNQPTRKRPTPIFAHLLCGTQLEHMQQRTSVFDATFYTAPSVDCTTLNITCHQRADIRSSEEKSL